jgi:hypothetical protein
MCSIYSTTLGVNNTHLTLKQQQTSGVNTTHLTLQQQRTLGVNTTHLTLQQQTLNVRCVLFTPNVVVVVT